MTNHEYLAEPDSSYPPIEQRSNTTLGCDGERLWLSEAQRCMSEVREYRTALAQNLQTIFEWQERGVLLNSVQRLGQSTAEIEMINDNENPLVDSAANVTCFNVLNFIIACNRLARADRLVVNVDVQNRPPLDPDADAEYFHKLISYNPTSGQKNLLVHSRYTTHAGEEYTAITRSIHGFRPTTIELGKDTLYIRAEHTGSSAAPRVEEILYVGPRELELLSFHDQHIDTKPYESEDEDRSTLDN